MIKIIAKQDFTIGNKFFLKGDEIKTRNFDAIVELNKNGLIEPLDYKDLVLIQRELTSKNKKEDEANGTII